jgi:hypothetical protein
MIELERESFVQRRGFQLKEDGGMVLGTVLGTWELFGSFNIKKMGAWELVS